MKYLIPVLILITSCVKQPQPVLNVVQPTTQPVIVLQDMIEPTTYSQVSIRIITKHSNTLLTVESDTGFVRSITSYTIDNLIYKDTLINFGDNVTIVDPGLIINQDSVYYSMVVIDKLKNQAPKEVYNYTPTMPVQLKPVFFVKQY